MIGEQNLSFKLIHYSKVLFLIMCRYNLSQMITPGLYDKDDKDVQGL